MALAYSVFGQKPAHQPPAESRFRRFLNRIAPRAILLSGLMGLASACNKTNCYKYNGTTVDLNGPVDGKVASLGMMRQDPPAGKRVRDELLDLVRETYAHSSVPMPDGVQLTFIGEDITSGHSECYQPGGGVVSYYDSGHILYGSDRGVYYLGDRIAILDFHGLRTVFHELGHIQAADDGYARHADDLEQGAELKAIEGMFTALAVFAGQEDSYRQMVMWLPHSLWPLFSVPPTAEKIKAQPDAEPVLDEYDQGRMYAYVLLLRHKGDFAAINAEYRALLEKAGDSLTARNAIRAVIRNEFFGRYAAIGPKDSAAATVLLGIRRMFYLGLQGTFGPDVAERYFSANEGYLASDPLWTMRVMLAGLDGLNCQFSSLLPAGAFSACVSGNPMCTIRGADSYQPVPRADLCCYDRSGVPFHVVGTGLSYKRSDGQMFDLSGTPATLVHSLFMISKTPLAEGSFCPTE